MDKSVSGQVISIMGCGWLGLPLAEYFISLGYNVKGSTTDKEKIPKLASCGIEPYHLEINNHVDEEKFSEFLKSDVLIINIPPASSKTDELSYPEKMKIIKKKLLASPIKKVLFVSSTSVYPELNREMTEEEMIVPASNQSKSLLKAEKLFTESKGFDTTVLRLSGLIGYNRNPAKLFAGKKSIANGRAPVNLIHRDDCILIIEQIIVQNKWGELYNACMDTHPTRKEFYTMAAKKLNLTLPEFEDNEPVNFKLVSNEKLKKELTYFYKYSDPVDTL
jgi:nucleoside-diphosphate-sugar epimerase